MDKKSVKTGAKQQYKIIVKAREMSRHWKKRGHYNGCNLHHFTHYIHLCLLQPVKHWPAQSYIFRSLPQLRETQQKMNWHKCLWKLNIRLVGSDPDWALCDNSPVLKSVLSLTEVEQLIDHSSPRGGSSRKERLNLLSVTAIIVAKERK